MSRWMRPFDARVEWLGRPVQTDRAVLWEKVDGPRSGRLARTMYSRRLRVCVRRPTSQGRPDLVVISQQLVDLGP